jgi:drug/metabolite transporter (DMT)-like permease
LLELKTFHVSREKWRRVWPWVLANALAGQTLGMTCVQWAYETTPAAIVAAIIALTPLILLPMTLFLDGEKIGARSIIGVAIAVGGVIGLALCR